MRDSSDDRQIMALAGQINSWDKVDANQIINTINDFEALVLKHDYNSEDFGISKDTIPTNYIPKLLKESGLVLATDKQKCCIFGSQAPYQVKAVAKVKASVKLLKRIETHD